MTKDTPVPTLYGASWCIPCKKLKEWLDKKHIPYKYVDVETLDGGQEELDRNNISSIPTLVMGNVRLHSPTEAELSVQFPS
jgi:glutaredoxin